MEYQKLIELLNEWNKEKLEEMENTFNFGTIDRAKFEYNEQEEYISYDGYQVNDYYIINKSTKFIERLVENDKIDLLKLTCMNPRYTEILDSDFSWEERIIMILSIEENPISFLFSILN